MTRGQWDGRGARTARNAERAPADHVTELGVPIDRPRGHGRPRLKLSAARSNIGGVMRAQPPQESLIQPSAPYTKLDLGALMDAWPAAGSADTELGVLMEPEVCHGATEVYTRVQA